MAKTKLNLSHCLCHVLCVDFMPVMTLEMGAFFFCFLWSVPVKSITVHSWAYVQPRHELLYQAWPEFHSRREKLSEFHVTLYKQCQMIVRLTKLCETPFQYLYIFYFLFLSEIFPKHTLYSLGLCSWEHHFQIIY